MSIRLGNLLDSFIRQLDGDPSDSIKQNVAELRPVQVIDEALRPNA